MVQHPLLPGDTILGEFDRVHGLLTVEMPGGRFVHILNAGFPVNFTGEVDPIRLHRIIGTRGLMLGAYLQAVRVAASMSRGASISGEMPLSSDLESYVRSFVRKARVTSRGKEPDMDSRPS